MSQPTTTTASSTITSNPSPTTTTPSSLLLQLSHLAHTLSALSPADMKQLKTDLKADKQVMKAEYKGRKQELKALPKDERKAAKMQLLGDVLAKFAERVGERQARAEMMGEDKTAVYVEKGDVKV